jgi:hypothetical protein
LIDKERDGAVVDRGLIKSCVQLFESMGMGSLSVYTIDFEANLLSSTRYIDILYMYYFHLDIYIHGHVFM